MCDPNHFIDMYDTYLLCHFFIVTRAYYCNTDINQIFGSNGSITTKAKQENGYGITRQCTENKQKKRENIYSTHSSIRRI